MRDLVREGAQYSSAEVLLFDGSPPHRGTTRNALGMLGFKRIVATSDADEVAHSIKQKPFDVLVADLAIEPERICQLVREVRQGDVGPNPFLVVIFTAWALREDTVSKVMGSGADDVLIRPYSVSFLAERVHTLVEARKGFVVTAEYIGPDRRKAAARSTDVKLLDVPNTLRIKARPEEYGPEAKDVMALVREAQAKLGELRLQGTALQMRLLAHFALRAANDGNPLDKYMEPMSVFSRLLQDRLQSSPTREAASAAVSLVQAVASIKRGEGVIDSLSHAGVYANTLHALLSSDRSEAERDAEFSRAVQRLSVREAQSFRERIAASR